MKEEQLLFFWDQLSPSQKRNLKEQIEKLDPKILQKQKNCLKKSPHIDEQLEPFYCPKKSGSKENKRRGKELLAKGKMGCLVLAGGQGTRLGFDGPKGMFPIVEKKTLFQLIVEKTKAAQNLVQHPLQLAFMVAEQHEKLVENYFQDNNFFGLLPSQIAFFSQKNLPFLNPDGHLFLEKWDSVAEGPDGNGSCFKYFYDSPIWQRWKNEGIEYVNVILIDNPLALPFDVELLAEHVQNKNEATLKCITKIKENEKVGIYVKTPEGIKVVEYSEMPELNRTARNEKGQLKYNCANISLFCFSMEFIKKCATEFFDSMSLHNAFKSVPYFDYSKKETIKPIQPNAWKFERFIFDVLIHAKKISGLLYPREECFAPLKNSIGHDSVQTVQESISNQEKILYERITKKKYPEKSIEIPMEYYFADLLD